MKIRLMAEMHTVVIFSFSAELYSAAHPAYTLHI